MARQVMSLEERQEWRERQRTALYRLFDEDGALLYVGITLDVRERWRHHRKHKPWWPQVAHEEFVWFDTRLEAEAAEVHAIVVGDPLHNRAKNWRRFKAGYQVRWLADRLREERASLCTPRRPRAKGKLARVLEVEAALVLLGEHAPQHWSAGDAGAQILRLLAERRAGRRLEPAESVLARSRFDCGECQTCGVPVPCAVVRALGDPYRDHPFFCM